VAVAAVIVGTAVAIVTATGSDHKHSGNRAAAAARGSREAAWRRGDIAVAARYLGLAPLRLRRELRSGRTLAEVAQSRKGKSEAGLIDALVAAKRARLMAAAQAGALTPAEERAALATLARRVAARVNRGGGYAAVAAAARLPDLFAAAAYLGMTADQLRVQLQSGRTLAQVANSRSGRSASGLMSALVSEHSATLAAAVAAGSLTSAREKTLLATFSQRVANELNRSWPTGGR
jgi:hypothetical protein